MHDLSSIPEGWSEERLGDILELKYGTSLPQQERKPGTIPVVGSAGIVGFHNQATVQGPGIVVGRKGSIGSVTWIDQDFVPIDTTYFVVPANGMADLRWLHHLLAREDLARLNRATGVPGLNRDDAYALKRIVPPLNAQRAIAAVLDAIDEAIERTSAVISATERLRDALLHELLTRGVPGWHTRWRKVFGIRIIPVDWEVVRLGEICEQPKYGAVSPARQFDPTLPRYVRITDLTEDGRLRTNDPRSADPSAVVGYELRSGDLLFARSGATVGKTYLYRSEDGPCVFAGYLIRFRVKPEIALATFVDIYTRSSLYRRWVNSMLRAGAQPNINASEYSSLPIPLPPLPEQRAIATVLNIINETIECTRKDLGRLRSFKLSISDALLEGRLSTRSQDWEMES